MHAFVNDLERPVVGTNLLLVAPVVVGGGTKSLPDGVVFLRYRTQTGG